MQQPLGFPRSLPFGRSGISTGNPFGRFVFQRSADETDEQWMWTGGPALELGMRLGASEKRMYVAWILHEFDQVAIGRRANRSPLAAMRSRYALFTWSRCRWRSDTSVASYALSHNRFRLQHRRVCAQTHRAAHVGLARDDLLLVSHRGDHRIRRLRVELGGIGLADPTDRAASITMHCRPRHSPSTGRPCVRA